MSDTQRYKQMGNAVTTNVIKSVGKKINRNIYKECFPYNHTKRR